MFVRLSSGQTDLLRRVIKTALFATNVRRGLSAGERSIPGAGGQSMAVRRAENRPAVPTINHLTRTWARKKTGRKTPRHLNGPLSRGPARSGGRNAKKPQGWRV